jgi:nitric oxide reductase activation protein
MARPDWTTIRESPARIGDAAAITAMLDADPRLRSQVSRLVRGARVGRAARLRRQAEGEELDLDAALDATIERRTGRTPDHRVHRGSGRRRRELAVAMLLDVSASTAASQAGDSVLDLQRQAVALLAGPLAPSGDAFTVLAFASNGREDVRLVTVKALDEAWSAEAQARLAGLSSGLSTRLGAALRHTGTVLQAARVHRRLALVLTDGAPFDIDTPDPADLAEDARHAVLSLKRAGVDVFGMILGQQDIGAAEAIFGRASCLAVPRLEALPARLSQMYARLTRA